MSLGIALHLSRGAVEKGGEVTSVANLSSVEPSHESHVMVSR